MTDQRSCVGNSHCEKKKDSFLCAGGEGRLPAAGRQMSPSDSSELSSLQLENQNNSRHELTKPTLWRSKIRGYRHSGSDVHGLTSQAFLPLRARKIWFPRRLRRRTSRT